MASLTQYVLAEGVRCGFATVEAFEEKIAGEEYEYHPQEEPSFHTRDIHRVVIRGFWETGDPIGISLSNPTHNAIKAAFNTVYTTYLPDRNPNYGHLLPATTKKMKIGIYDENVATVDYKSFDKLIERIDEMMTSHAFQGLSIQKVQLSKTLNKIYIANTNELQAKYRKTLFKLHLSLAMGDNLIDVHQSRIYFQQLDPLRLISRGLNLLCSLTENRIHVPVGKDIFLILAPEASAQILKEFSSYFKTRVDPEIQNIQYPPILNLVDDHLLDGQAASVPFDDEGMQRQSGEKYLIKKGVFSRVVHNIASAFEQKSQSTASGFRNQRNPFPGVGFSNLYIKPTVLPLKNLRDDAGEGVVVALVKLKDISNRGYLFSAYGYRFKNHHMLEPVHFHFRTTLRSYLLNILKISKEIKFFHSVYSIGSPYIMVRAAGKADTVLEI